MFEQVIPGKIHGNLTIMCPYEGAKVRVAPAGKGSLSITSFEAPEFRQLVIAYLVAEGYTVSKLPELA